MSAPVTTAFIPDLSWHWPSALPTQGIALKACRFDPKATPASHTLPEHLQRAALKRQQEYLAGRWCVAQAQQALGLSVSNPAIGADRAPQWPTEQCGSISHSQGRAAAIVADRRYFQSAGLDIEHCLTKARAQRLAGEILTPAELQQWQNLPNDQQARALTVSFCLKEALFKTLYPLTGVRFYFHDAECDNTADNTIDSHASSGQSCLRLRKTLSPAWPAGRELTAHWQWHESAVLGLLAIAHDE